MNDMKTTTIEQPGSIGKWKAAQLGRYLAGRMQDPEFFAEVEEKNKEGKEHERNHQHPAQRRHVSPADVGGSITLL